MTDTRRKNSDNEQTKKVNINIYLIVICIVLILIILYKMMFGGYVRYDNSRTQFLNSVISLQSEMSYYIGKTKAETFEVYSNLQLLSGVSNLEDENSKITLEESKEIIQISSVKKEDIVEKSSNKYYKLIKENLQKNFQTKAFEDENITYYVDSECIVKIKLDKKPAWWDDSLDFLVI